MKFLFFAFLLIPVFFIIPAKKSRASESPYPDYSLGVRCRDRVLKGRAVINFPEGAERKVYLGDLRIITASFNGKPVSPRASGTPVLVVSGKGTLLIEYEKTFENGAGRAGGNQLENPGVVTGDVFTDKAISLTSFWYPRLEEGLAYYHLEAAVPAGFKAVSEAEEITVTHETGAESEYRFSFSHPLEGIDLVAAPYVVEMEKHGGLDIYAYFLPGDKDLIKDYLEKAGKYFNLYGEMLAPYPYKRFSVVENVLPTGYSMPTFTLLGAEVVRLPFITDTSLGHEILHQWFGNSVYGDPSRGNWWEALTTYMADQLYEEQKGEGPAYRKRILSDYRAYVTPRKEMPLKDFRGRLDEASRAVGYGKGAMVFHMLKKRLGEKVFIQALRDFIRDNTFAMASWPQLEKAFEDASHENLDWFFQQWLERKDVPSFTIESAGPAFINGVRGAAFEVRQLTDPPYRFDLPVKIVSDTGEIKKIIPITKDVTEASIGLSSPDEKPLKLIVDEDYDLMRQISDDEYPPVIARLLGAEKKVAVYQAQDKQKYESLLRALEEDGFTLIEEKDLKDKDISGSSVAVMGAGSPVLKRLFGERLFGKPEAPAGGFTIKVRLNPLSPGKVLAIVNADSAEETAAAARKIFHYGNYSYLQFQAGINIKKERTETDRGIIDSLYDPVPAVETSSSRTLEQFVMKNASTPVIYLGEVHTSYADHLAQFDAIAALARAGRKFAIGMEMFQKKPGQAALDKYLAGQINEREFLKESEYFQRWGMDYLLYRDIINFAKSRKIPIVALNIRKEITEKVAVSGLDSLTAEQWKEIPPDMDMSNLDYRKRIEEAYSHHREGKPMSFENFYQSQILWDETMAHSVAGYLNEHPGSQMVVLAGAQHVIYSEGIPDRAYRLTGKDYVTLATGEVGFDPDIANAVFFAPEPERTPASPVLGIILSAEKGQISIDDVQAGSNGETAGLKKGDTLLEIDNWPVKSIYDGKIALFDKKIGDTFTVKILRRRFLFGEREMDIPVTIYR